MPERRVALIATLVSCPEKALGIHCQEQKLRITSATFF
jgi:hypothetical protein